MWWGYIWESLRLRHTCLFSWLALIYILSNKTVIINILLSWILWMLSWVPVILANYWTQGSYRSLQICSQLVNSGCSLGPPDLWLVLKWDQPGWGSGGLNLRHLCGLLIGSVGTALQHTRHHRTASGYMSGTLPSQTLCTDCSISLSIFLWDPHGWLHPLIRPCSRVTGYEISLNPPTQPTPT